MSTENPQLLCHILAALGEMYEVVGSVDNALNVYREALKISLSTNDAVTVGHARGRLTRLSLQQHGAKRGQRAAQQGKPLSAGTYADLPLAAAEAPIANTLRKRVVAEPVYLTQIKP